jgi:hypothetical protein
MSDAPLTYSAWRRVLTLYSENGSYNERTLAQLVLELLDVQPEHPDVIALMNSKTLEMLERADRNKEARAM